MLQGQQRMHLTYSGQDWPPDKDRYFLFFCAIVERFGEMLGREGKAGGDEMKRSACRRRCWSDHELPENEAASSLDKLRSPFDLTSCINHLM